MSADGTHAGWSHEAPIPLTAAQEEAERLMRICNACRYCEGLCAMFPAMELRRNFAAGDLDYLANLCHNCGACYHDCQYAPPHEFGVNVPQTMTQLRAESWGRHMVPGAMAPALQRNGLTMAWAAALSVAAFLFAFMAWSDPEVMFGTVTGEGAFYAIMPHDAMAWLFGAAFLWAILGILWPVRRFWRFSGGKAPSLRAFGQALRDAGELRYLDGGGDGCGVVTERPTPWRRRFHHMTFYGFLLCFASTSVATLYHYIGGVEAPYPVLSLPVILGTVGGIGITVGPIGLWRLRKRRDPALGTDADEGGMNAAFLAMLAGVGVTGLALLAFRATPLMGTLLALHLGLVFAFFLTMPFGKFVHAFYRTAALVRYAMERPGA